MALSRVGSIPTLSEEGNNERQGRSRNLKEEMSHKTNVLGFRRGVEAIRLEGGRQGYAEVGDLIGGQSTWVSTSKSQYGDQVRKDRRIRTLLTDRLEEEGCLLNQLKIQRGASGVSVYVDGYLLEDQTIISGVFGEDRPTTAKVDGSEGVRDIRTQAGRERRETAISKQVEGGQPVSIRFVLLNQYLKEQSGEEGEESAKSGGVSDGLGAVDRQNLLRLLRVHHVACVPALTKLLGYLLGGGRQPQESVRRCGTLIQQTYDTVVKQERASAKKTYPVNQNRRVQAPKVTPKNLEERVRLEKVAGVRGVYVQWKGRLGGSERSRIVRFRRGPRPRHTLAAARDYGHRDVNTPVGTVSVSVWRYVV